MKNFYKINRFKLFHIKKERKKNTLSSKKKSDERIMRENIENIAFRQYNKLKHHFQHKWIHQLIYIVKT